MVNLIYTQDVRYHSLLLPGSGSGTMYNDISSAYGAKPFLARSCFGREQVWMQRLKFLLWLSLFHRSLTLQELIITCYSSTAVNKFLLFPTIPPYPSFLFLFSFFKQSFSGLATNRPLLCHSRSSHDPLGNGCVLFHINLSGWFKSLTKRFAC